MIKNHYRSCQAGEPSQREEIRAEQQVVVNHDVRTTRWEGSTAADSAGESGAKARAGKERESISGEGGVFTKKQHMLSRYRTCLYM